jgi:hypothetical protein
MTVGRPVNVGVTFERAGKRVGRGQSLIVMARVMNRAAPVMARPLPPVRQPVSCASGTAAACGRSPGRSRR